MCGGFANTWTLPLPEIVEAMTLSIQIMIIRGKCDSLCATLWGEGFIIKSKPIDMSKQMFAHEGL